MASSNYRIALRIGLERRRRLLALFTLLGCFLLSPNAHANPAQDGASAPKSGDDSNPADDKGQSAEVTAGRVSVYQLLELLEIMSETNVVVPADLRPFAEAGQFDFLSPQPLTLELIREVLRVNGFQLIRKEPPRGSGLPAVLRLQIDPKRQIQSSLLIHPIATRVEDLVLANPGTIATAIISLDHAPASSVVAILKDLFQADAKTGAALFKLVAEGSDQRMIARGPIRLLRHVFEVAAVIDQPKARPDSNLIVRELRYADVLDTVELLRQAIEAQARPNEPLATSFIPDPRTRKILIRSTNPDQLELVLGLIEELDIRPNPLYSGTHIYQVKYHKASDLHAIVVQLLAGTDLEERFRLVPHDASNTIIIRGRAEGRIEVLNFLIQEDVPESGQRPEQDLRYEVKSVSLRHVSASLLANVLSEHLRELSLEGGEVLTRVVSVPSRNMLIFRSPRRDRLRYLENFARAFDQEQFRVLATEEIFLWKSRRPAAEIALELGRALEEAEIAAIFRLATEDRIALKVDRYRKSDLLEVLHRLDRK